MKTLYSQLLENISEQYKYLTPSFEGFLHNGLRKSLTKISPVKTLGISLTDAYCQQNCRHCNGHYLRGMQPFSKISVVDFEQYNSILISGGSSKSGHIPINEHIASLLSLPSHLKFNIHPGFQPVENLLGFNRENTVISFDLPSCDEVVRNIFKLKYSSNDYKELYLNYKKKFRTIPHITIGLAQNTCNSEIETIDFLKKQDPEKVVFLVFRPTPDTEMQNIAPPSLEKVIKIVKHALENLNCQINLGCMRPSGAYRKNLDILMWMHGIKTMVMPNHQLQKILSNNDIEITTKNQCCSFK